MMNRSTETAILSNGLLMTGNKLALPVLRPSTLSEKIRDIILIIADRFSKAVFSAPALAPCAVLNSVLSLSLVLLPEKINVFLASSEPRQITRSCICSSWKWGDNCLYNYSCWVAHMHKHTSIHTLIVTVNPYCPQSSNSPFKGYI